MKPSFLSPNEIRSAISHQSSSSKSGEASSGGSASIRKPSPLFGGGGIQQPSALFSVHGACHPSPIPELTTVPTDASTFHQLLPVPTPGLAADISNNGVVGDVSAVDDSGHDTPSCIDNAMPIKEMETCKMTRKIRTKEWAITC
jgi:hypothetical protein